jgi:RNA polymerase sigma factor (sigma-70 family)
MGTQSTNLMHYLRRWAAPARPEAGTDAELLTDFVCHRDEAALTALVSRHGPMVLRVCQRVLGNPHDAEDVFQATFLVLACRARAIRRRDRLAAWLHGVAHRLASKALAGKLRRQQLEGAMLVSAPIDPAADPLAQLTARELVNVVDREVQRLPEAQRLPVILCCLEGRSVEEAARQLGWTQGSVKGRLERGRARLHERLVRRGLTLSAALAAGISQSTTSAALVAPLVAGAVRSALAFASGRPAVISGASTAAAALAAGMLKSLSVARLKIAAAFLLLTAFVTTGWMILRAGPEPDQVVPIRLRPPGQRQADELPLDPDAPIQVSGRVLDPQDGPIAGARLFVGFSAGQTAAPLQFGPMNYPRRATSSTDGRFEFTFTPSELDAAALDHSRPAVIAVAQGYGPAWAVIKGSAADTQLSLKLAEDFPVEGRILTLDQQPVAGARVLVWEIGEGSEQAFANVFRGEVCGSTGKGCRGPLPEQLPFVTTMPDGRFHLTGLGRDRIVTLIFEGAEARRTFVWAATRPRPDASSPEAFSLTSFNYRAPLSRRLRGRVRDKATGRPVAGVKVSARPNRFVGSFFRSLTDETGAYELLVPPQPDGWMVQAQPETGQPYFAASAFVPDKPGCPGLAASTVGLVGSAQGQGPFVATAALFPGRTDPSAADAILDIDLMSGRRLQGRVVDQATGKPPKKAVVEYYPLAPDPHSADLTGGPDIAASSCVVRADGSYGLVVLPGPGVVCVAASPQDRYAGPAIDEAQLAILVRNRMKPEDSLVLRRVLGIGEYSSTAWNRYQVLSLIDPDEGAKLPALNLALTRKRGGAARFPPSIPQHTNPKR